MPARDFEGVFYIQQPPEIILRDGMFHICFKVSNRAQLEFVMSPNTYLKARRSGTSAIDEFHEKGRNVATIRKRTDKKLSDSGVH